MKTKAFLLIVIFFVSINAQTTYYFSTSGNDANNGTSSASPKQTLSALQTLLDTAQPGDNFLLKRGDTWTTRAGIYGLDISADGTASEYIVIGAYGTGNKPVFDFSGTDYMIRFYSGTAAASASYLKIENIKFTSTALPLTNRPDDAIFFNGSGQTTTSPSNIIISNCVIDSIIEGINAKLYANNITIENCTISNTGLISNRAGNGVYSSAPNTIIRDNIFNGCATGDNTTSHSIYISRMNDCLVENNIIDGKNAKGNLVAVSNARRLTIRGNTVFSGQSGGIGGGPQDYTGEFGFYEDVLIEKNIVYNAPFGISIVRSNGGGTVTGTAVGDNIKIINNIIYNGLDRGVRIYNAASQKGIFSISNVTIANNTFYNNVKGIWISSSNMTLGNGIAVKNNILFNNLYPSGTLLEIDNAADISQIDFNYNLYYTVVGNDTKVGTTLRTLSAFKSAFPNEEQNGISTNPLFINILNFIFQLNENSIAIDNGANLSSVGVNDDFEGNQRPAQNGFDIGAYEFGSSSSGSNINVNTKILLEGPFNNGTMVLLLNGVLPLSQPYNQAPWNYNGNESVSSVPSDVVDWVLLELRTGTSSSGTVARKAALLKSDGTIVNLDGSTNPTFAIAEGNYYLVIMHRNHLSIMSANAISLNGNSSLYDFTTGPSKAFGTNPLTNLGNGKWGMYAGDGDLNNLVNVIDYGSVGNYLFQTGYKFGDLDLNGIINVMDYAKTNLNLFKNSQVPN